MSEAPQLIEADQPSASADAAPQPIDTEHPTPEDAAPSILPPVEDQDLSDAYEEWSNETTPPDIFNEGTFAPGYLDNFTLPPGMDQSDLWFLQGGTLAPKFKEGGTLPPFLMRNDTLAPGLFQGGELAIDFIIEDWTKDLLPNLNGFSLETEVAPDPVFLSVPFTEYERAPLTTSFAGIPRLGHSKDISRLGLLLSDQAPQEQASDYLFGLSFVAGFIFSYFLLWGLGLCLSKCLSRSFLGGRPFVQVPTQNEDESEAEKQTGRISSLWTRMAFFIAGSLVIVFAILLGVMGTSKMQDTSSEIETTSGTLKEMLGEATHVSVLLHSLHALSAALHDRIELEYENPCPGFEAYDTSDLGKKMNDAFGSTLDKLKTLKVDLEEGVDLLEDEIKNIEDGVDTFDRAVQDANDYELMGQLIGLPYLVLTGMLLVGVVVASRNAMPKKFECFLNWAVLPVFIVLTIISFVLCSVFLVSATANADFCGGKESTPDQTVLDFLVKGEIISSDQYIFKAAEYYVYQCTDKAAEDALLDLRTYQGDITTGKEVVSEFISQIKPSIDKISFGCNKEFDPLLDSMEEALRMFDLAQAVVDAIFTLMDCDRISTMYTNIFYTGSCTHSIEGFTWTFSCLLVISFMSMTMITLRSSYQNTLVAETGEGPDALKAREDLKSIDGVTKTSMNDSGDQHSCRLDSAVDVEEGGIASIEEGDTHEVAKSDDAEQADQATDLSTDDHVRKSTQAMVNENGMDFSC